MACFKFLALPGELRNMIYRFTLTVDPPAMKREHKYTCEKWLWHPAEPVKLMWRDGKRNSRCSCARRTGLRLLLVNRQIYREGASIFWAENHFTFWNPEHFIELVGNRLRPQWRKTLRSISVIDDRIHWSQPLSNTRHDTFSRLVSQCQGLHNLELARNLDWELLRRGPTRNRPGVEAAAWADLRPLLPELKTRTATQCWMAYRVFITWSLHFAASPPEQLTGSDAGADRFRVHDNLIMNQLQGWAWNNRPSFPDWMDVLEETENEWEYSCRVRRPGHEVMFTARKLWSYETFVRNRVLREADRVRGEARKESLRKLYGWKERLRPRNKRTTTAAKKATY